jgi:hypothetical protein
MIIDISHSFDYFRYPLGNHAASEYYIAHFKGFYGLTNKFISDTSTARPPATGTTSASISRQANATTPSESSGTPKGSAASLSKQPFSTSNGSHMSPAVATSTVSDASNGGASAAASNSK